MGGGGVHYFFVLLHQTTSWRQQVVQALASQGKALVSGFIATVILNYIM